MEPSMTPDPAQTAPKPATGALIALILVVAALAVGAFFLFEHRLGMQAKSDVESLSTQSTSTDPKAIESDIDAQSSEDFDKSIDGAFSDVDASFDAK